MGTINDMSDAELLPLLRFLFPWLFETPQLTPGTLVRRLPGGGVLDDGTAVQLHGDHALNGVVLTNRAGGSAPGRMSTTRRIVGRRINGLAGGAVTRALSYGLILAGNYGLNAPQIISGPTVVARNWRNLIHLLYATSPGINGPEVRTGLGLGPAGEPPDLSGLSGNYTYVQPQTDGQGNVIHPASWWSSIAHEHDGPVTHKPIYAGSEFPDTQFSVYQPGTTDAMIISSGEWRSYGAPQMSNPNGVGRNAWTQVVRIGTTLRVELYVRAIRPTEFSPQLNYPTQYTLYLERISVVINENGAASDTFSRETIGTWTSVQEDDQGRLIPARYDGGSGSVYSGTDPDEALRNALNPARHPLPNTAPQGWTMEAVSYGAPRPVSGPIVTDGADPADAASAWHIPCQTRALASDISEDGTPGLMSLRLPAAVVAGQRVPATVAPGGIIVSGGPDLPEQLEGVLLPTWTARTHPATFVASLGNTANWLRDQGVSVSLWDSLDGSEAYNANIQAQAIPAQTLDGTPIPPRDWLDQPNTAQPDYLSTGERTATFTWPGTSLGMSLRVGLLVSGVDVSATVTGWTYEHPDYGQIAWEPTDGWQEQLKAFREEQVLTYGDLNDFNRAGTLTATVALTGSVWAVNLMTC